MIVLLDTTMLIDVLSGRPGPTERMTRMVKTNCLLVTSAINVAELHAGIRPGEEMKTQRLLSVLEVYPVTDRIARRGGDLKRAWSLKGQTLSLQDTLIAATALEHDLVVLTSNRKDFPMPELCFYDLP